MRNRLVYKDQKNCTAMLEAGKTYAEISEQLWIDPEVLNPYLDLLSGPKKKAPDPEETPEPEATAYAPKPKKKKSKKKK